MEGSLCIETVVIPAIVNQRVATYRIAFRSALCSVYPTATA